MKYQILKVTLTHISKLTSKHSTLTGNKYFWALALKESSQWSVTNKLLEQTYLAI